MTENLFNNGDIFYIGNHTESADFKDGNHCANFHSIWIVEELAEVRAGDYATHNAERQ